jgi:hypothetical protein
VLFFAINTTLNTPSLVITVTLCMLFLSIVHTQIHNQLKWGGCEVEKISIKEMWRVGYGESTDNQLDMYRIQYKLNYSLVWVELGTVRSG